MSALGRIEGKQNSLTEWLDGREERLEGFLTEFRDCFEKNEIGLAFLAEIISDNEDRVRIGHNNIIILGNLASYAIPVRLILQMMTNPFRENGSFGMPRIEVHPRGRWVQNNTMACIQSQAGPEVPASDVIASMVLGLLSDEELYRDESQDSFRSSLLILYGLTNSPITDILSDRISSKDAILDMNYGEIRFKGTHGFTWHLGFLDPEVSSFTVSSSIRDGPRRLHMEDTYRWISDCKNIDKLIAELSLYPRGLMREHQHQTIERLSRYHENQFNPSPQFAECNAFLNSVGQFFAPLEGTNETASEAFSGEVE